ncbi:MAG: beta-lactamase [Proteobacteria bacterium]|nr:class C beta-lactamase [Methylibium sp.]MBY0367154.1 beta-lactamase [Burkholderiaceae bacterium]MCH8857301.1 beta-lactamase [Pseudomonadota bacterium]
MHRRILQPFAPFLALALGLSATAAQAFDEAGIRAAVDTTIGPLMSQHDIPGMAVAITVDGRAYVFNYGVMSRRGQEPVTDHTLFEVGSVTKVLTATLAAYAASLGKLSLDAHPSRYLPALKGAAIDKATVLQLACFTAGDLPLQFPDSLEGDDAAALNYFRHWQPTAAPGVVRSYSNPSLALLGWVTARALGQDYSAAMQTRLFPAFGMSRSHVQVPEGSMPNYAWGHRDDRQVRMQRGPMAEPVYGLRTTASDLLLFVQANLDPSTLAPPLRRAVAATQIGHYRSGPLVQGLGWEQYPYPVSREWLLGGNAEEMILQPQPAQRLAGLPDHSPRLFNKTGSTGGFGAYVAFVPQRRVGLVMLANRNYPIPSRIEAAWTILKAVAGDD